MIRSDQGSVIRLASRWDEPEKVGRRKTAWVLVLSYRPTSSHLAAGGRGRGRARAGAPARIRARVPAYTGRTGREVGQTQDWCGFAPSYLPSYPKTGKTE